MFTEPPKDGMDNLFLRLNYTSVWSTEPRKDGMGNFLLAKINERVIKETPLDATRGKLPFEKYLFLFKNTTKLCNHSICGSQEIYKMCRSLLKCAEPFIVCIATKRNPQSFYLVVDQHFIFCDDDFCNAFRNLHASFYTFSLDYSIQIKPFYDFFDEIIFGLVKTENSKTNLEF